MSTTSTPQSPMAKTSTASNSASQASGGRRSGISASSRSTVSTTSMKRDDFLFILSWRDKKTKAKTSTELLAEVPDITADELEALSCFKEVDEAFTESLRAEGWFSRSAETVEGYVESFIRENGGYITPSSPPGVGYPPYNRLVNKYTDVVLITRMLKFYSMKGKPIVLRHVLLTEEQEAAILPPNEDIDAEIVVVNSGPGTGKTETLTHRADALKDEGVIFVAFTNTAVEQALRRLRKIVSNIEDVDIRLDVIELVETTKMTVKVFVLQRFSSAPSTCL